jgi:hypothetical protein
MGMHVSMCEVMFLHRLHDAYDLVDHGMNFAHVVSGHTQHFRQSIFHRFHNDDMHGLPSNDKFPVRKHFGGQPITVKGLLTYDFFLELFLFLRLNFLQFHSDEFSIGVFHEEHFTV